MSSTKPLIRFFYSIEGLYPPDGQGLGRGGFFTYLERKFSREALSTKLSEENIKRYQQDGEKIIERAWRRNPGASAKPYSFHDGTCLLRYCVSPGDACDLSIQPPEEIEYLKRELGETNLAESRDDLPIEYHPHNVDSPIQAYILLSLWTHWARTIQYTINQ